MSQPTLAPMPGHLDLQANYTLRVIALDASTGATVTGVNIGATVITASPLSVSTGGVGDFEQGDWYLVPGPGA